MTEVHPILLVDFDRRDLSNKKGRNIPGPPLVEVDTIFRSSLASQLENLARELKAAGANVSYPAPVKIRLHAKSLAKSNRPYTLLNKAALPVKAVDRPGELIVAATSESLRSLRSEILSGTDPRSMFEISTFVSFSRWSPKDDVLAGFSAASAASSREQLRASAGLVEISLFPWLSATKILPTYAVEAFRNSIGAGAAEDGSLETHESAELGAEGAGLGPVLGRRPSTTVLDLICLAGLGNAVAVNERSIYATASSGADIQSLSKILGIRRMRAAPLYGTLDSASVDIATDASQNFLLGPVEGIPTVGVLDSGISSARLASWVVGRSNSDPAQYIDAFHGTFVAGLIADSRVLNGRDERFPDDSSRVFDGQILPRGGLNPLLLIERIREIVLANASEIHVWNCSFALTSPLAPPEYSVIAQEMDVLSRELGVLFVQAAGNFVNWPDRAWPPNEDLNLEDGVSSPGEAIRSVTVGALSHLGGFVPVGAPSSYSRRGPSFAIQVKPEVTHWGGEVDGSGAVAGHGIKSVSTSDQVIESIGTSFATPLVSTIAANLWQELERGRAVSEVRPELIKGLLAHSAALAGDAPGNEHRSYTGWGRPASSQKILTDSETSFTTIHEVILSPQTQWVLSPFPVPACLIVDGNRFAGEAILTISYDPPIRSEFGPEAVRYEVEAGFGFRAAAKNGEEGFRSITKEQTAKSSFWEVDQIDDGKWSSLRTYRARHPKGIQGEGDWALRLALLQRMQHEIGTTQKAYAILTLRSVGAPLPVRVDGVDALRNLRLSNRAVVRSDQIRVQG